MGKRGRRTSRGRSRWVELATTDADGAKDFYGELFGWAYEDVDDGRAARYTMAQRRRRTSSPALMQADEPAALELLHHRRVRRRRDREGRGGRRRGRHASPFDVGDAGPHGRASRTRRAASSRLWEAEEHHRRRSLVNAHGALTWNDLHDPRRRRRPVEFYVRGVRLGGRRGRGRRRRTSRARRSKRRRARSTAAWRRSPRPPATTSRRTGCAYFAVDDIEAALEGRRRRRRRGHGRPDRRPGRARSPSSPTRRARSSRSVAGDLDD